MRVADRANNDFGPKYLSSRRRPYASGNLNGQLDLLPTSADLDVNLLIAFINLNSSQWSLGGVGVLRRDSRLRGAAPSAPRENVDQTDPVWPNSGTDRAVVGTEREPPLFVGVSHGTTRRRTDRRIGQKLDFHLGKRLAVERDHPLDPTDGFSSTATPPDNRQRAGRQDPGDASHRYGPSETTSPDAYVDRYWRMVRLVPSAKNRTEPSQKAKFAPPGCWLLKPNCRTMWADSCETVSG